MPRSSASTCSIPRRCPLRSRASIPSTTWRTPWPAVKRGSSCATCGPHVPSASSARESGVKHIIYLGGLGDPASGLSAHLSSRQEVGAELASHGVPVTEFRAAVIIGSGSASFELLRSLVEHLPVMITPRWVRTLCQPIGIRDVLDYLVAAADQSDRAGIVEIGGPDVLSYAEMMHTYARLRGHAPPDDPGAGAHPQAQLLLVQPGHADPTRASPGH